MARIHTNRPCFCFARRTSLILLWFLTAHFASAALIRVPLDQPTIQQAINAARAGDFIIVSPGVYRENINIGGRTITLRSTSMTSAAIVAATVIDGRGLGPVVTFSGTELTTGLFSGFTIRNGHAGSGGGICGNGTVTQISYNVITSNTATYGGGVFNCAFFHHNTLTSNVAVYGGGVSGGNTGFYNNVVRNNRAQFGGAFASLNDYILNNVITSNTAQFGGAIYSGIGIIQGNTITSNTATDSGGAFARFDGTVFSNDIVNNSATSSGGAFFQCQGTLQSNTVSSNTASLNGGGLHSCNGNILGNTIIANHADNRGGGFYQCDGRIEGNTISGNVAEDTGGGLDDCDGIIFNNTIVGNGAQGGGGLCDCDGPVSSNTIQRNIVTGNGGGVLRGGALLVTNRITSNTALNGGGIAETSGTILGNTISDNTAGQLGGGIFRSQGPVRGNTINGNVANQSGGGLAECSDAVTTNIITGNSAAFLGGGIYACGGPIQRNRIESNTASDSGGGLYGCDGAIQNNFIAGNSANDGGGLDSCRGAIQNNTITGNTASGSGGGIHFCRATIQNCILWQNSAASNPQIDPFNPANADSSSTPTYSCIQGWTLGGTGNISVDPGFVDLAHGDFHLMADSPCVDSGGNVPGLTEDFDGHPRPVRAVPEIRGDGSTYDIGAIEYQPVAPVPLIDALPQYTSGTARHLNWTPVPRVISYFLQRSTEPSFAMSTTIGRYIFSTSYTVTGLLDGQKLYYRVAGVAPSYALGPWSNVVSSTQDDAPPQTSVTPLPAIITTVSFPVSWTGNDSVSGLAAVNLFYSHSPTGPFTQYGGDFTASPITFDTALTGGDGLYFFYTRGRDNVGHVEAAPAAPQANTRVAATPPSAPVMNPEPTYMFGTWNVLSWSTVPGTLYFLEWSTNSSFAPVTGSSGWTPTTVLAATGLTDGQIYYYRVKCRNTYGVESVWSNVVHATQDNSAPTAPGTPRAGGRYTSSTSVTFRWTPATDAVSGVAWYGLEVGRTPGANDLYSGNVGNVLSKTVVGINDRTMYARVRAHDNVGNTGPWSGNSDPITIDTERPRLLSVFTVNDITLVANFHEDVFNADLPSNYTCTGGLRIVDVLRMTNKKYRLYTTKQSKDIRYTLTVKNGVVDKAGNPMDPRANSYTFRGNAATAVESWRLYR
jgi:hypothetical protein